MKPYISLLLFCLLAIACQQEVFSPVSFAPEDEYIIDRTTATTAPVTAQRVGFFGKDRSAVASLVFVDRATGLTIAVNVDPAASCDPASGPEVDQGIYPLFAIQHIEVDDDPLTFQYLAAPAVVVDVYPRIYLPEDTWCAFVKTTAPIASGTLPAEGLVAEFGPGSLTQSLRSGSFRFIVQGTLHSAEGTPIRLEATYRGSWLGRDEHLDLQELAQVRLE